MACTRAESGFWKTVLRAWYLFISYLSASVSSPLPLIEAAGAPGVVVGVGALEDGCAAAFNTCPECYSQIAPFDSTDRIVLTLCAGGLLAFSQVYSCFFRNQVICR